MNYKIDFDSMIGGKRLVLIIVITIITIRSISIIGLYWIIKQLATSFNDNWVIKYICLKWDYEYTVGG